MNKLRFSIFALILSSTIVKAQDIIDRKVYNQGLSFCIVITAKDPFTDEKEHSMLCHGDDKDLFFGFRFEESNRNVNLFFMPELRISTNLGQAEEYEEVNWMIRIDQNEVIQFTLKEIRGNEIELIQRLLQEIGNGVRRVAVRRGHETVIIELGAETTGRAITEFRERSGL